MKIKAVMLVLVRAGNAETKFITNSDGVKLLQDNTDYEALLSKTNIDLTNPVEAKQLMLNLVMVKKAIDELANTNSLIIHRLNYLTDCMEILKKRQDKLREKMAKLKDGQQNQAKK